ncbi:recombinase family protein [Pseudomonas monachiensis]|uniref:Recombinase family protein n=1 Tax=Pseudomonas monachiensis TaxID=3060212 RepID=A0ABW9H9B6_9PSED
MPMAISYIRFSTGKQAKGNSQERQKEAVNRWLKANPEYTPSDLSFADLGKSGYHGEHIKLGGGWSKLLIAVEAGHIQSGDVVLVEAMDRTGRLEPFDMLDIIRPVLKAGVAIITLDDGTKFDQESVKGSHMYLLVAKIQATHQYSDSLSDRIKKGYATRRKNAINGEGVKRHTAVWLTTDGKLKDDIAPHIKEVFNLYISGVGKHAIANRLRETGIPEFATTVGSTVGKWLNNKSAIGYWKSEKHNIDIPNVCEPVVTHEIFNQAKKRRDEAKTSPKTYTSKNFLVGLIKCGVCGANYSIHRKEGKPHNMRCLKHHLQRDAGCTNNETIPYAVIRYIYSLTAQHWLGKALQKTQLSINEKRKLEVEVEIAEVKASIDKIVDVIDIVPDNAELVGKLSLLNDKRKQLNDELEILSRTVDGDSDFHEVSLAESNLLLNDPVKLNSLLKMSGYALTVHPQKLITAAEELYPWLYVGVKRSGNNTVGYRIHYLGTETVISPDSPETPDWGLPTDNFNEKIRYMMRKEHKPISIGKPVDWIDLE